MKRLASALLCIFLFSTVVEASNEILYRVHVGSYKKIDAPKDVRKIPKMKKYVLPEGYYCFFSGGYYYYYEGASRALNVVKEMGYENAVIRVFKDDRLLSVDAAQKYIMKEMANPTPIPSNQKVDRQIYSINEKKTLGNRIILFKEVTQPKEDDSLNLALNTPEIALKMKKFTFKGLSWFKWNKDKDKDKPEDEIASNDKSEDDEVMESEVLSQSSEMEADETEELEVDTADFDPELLLAVKEAVVEEKAEEIIEENDDELVLPEGFKVDDIPFFKIYLASAETGKETPLSVQYVPDIVYTYEKKDLTLYAVGYYASSAEAQEDLKRYQEKGFYNAKIIAIYKTIVVSQNMGDEILNRVK